MMMTSLIIRSLLPILLLLAFSTSTTYASDMLIMGLSGDGSMVQSDCGLSVTHSGLTGGVPKLVQTIYDELYASCVDAGSNGKYKNKMKRYTDDISRTRVLQEQVDAKVEEEEGELERELNRGMMCYGVCSTSAILSYSQCDTCCLAYKCSWCAGTFASKPCTMRRRLGAPAEAFHDEMRRLGDAATEEKVAGQCRSDLRKATKILNNLGNFCHGNDDQIEVSARLP